jgi:hypothetical protein
MGPKGTIQQILRGIDMRLKRSGLLNWRPGSFLFLILEGHHHERSINHYQQPKQNQLALSAESDTMALFSTVRYTL